MQTHLLNFHLHQLYLEQHAKCIYLFLSLFLQFLISSVSHLAFFLLLTCKICSRYTFYVYCLYLVQIIRFRTFYFPISLFYFVKKTPPPIYCKRFKKIVLRNLVFSFYGLPKDSKIDILLRSATDYSCSHPSYQSRFPDSLLKTFTVNNDCFNICVPL